MTATPPDATDDIAPFTDPTAPSDRSDVPLHVDTDVVPAAQFDVLADSDDMAIVGVTRDDGRVLLRRLTPDCDFKLPVVTVADEDEFVAAAARAVETVVGLPTSLDAVEGVWRLEAEAEDDGRTATRTFVVFSATPATAPDTVELPTESEGEATPAAVGWFDAFPEDGAPLPGNDLFFG